MTDEIPATSAAETAGGRPEVPPESGLRNPRAAARGVGAGALFLEAIVVLLALQPIRVLSPDAPGWGLAVVLALAVGCVVVAALLRHPWAWSVGTALQVAVFSTGVLLPAMFVLGAVFLGIWVYVLRVRRTLSRPARFDH